MRQLMLAQQDKFTGDFIIEAKDKAGNAAYYSIGDYLEVRLLSAPRVIQHTKEAPALGGGFKTLSVTEFYLRVECSTERKPFDCVLRVFPGEIQDLWHHGLVAGRVHVVKSYAVSNWGKVLYRPQIDGHISGKAKH